MFRNLSIRAKLFWVSVLTTSTGLLVACAAFVAYDLLTFREAMVERLSAQAEIVGRNSAATLIFDDPDAASVTLAALSAEPQIVTAAIYTKGGRLFAQYRAAEFATSPAPTLDFSLVETHRFDADRLTLFRSIFHDGSRVGYVALEAHLGALTMRIRRFAAIAAIVLFVALVAAILIAMGLQRTISRPLLRLADVARRVSREKDYSIRAAASSHDETGLLVESFNDMLEQIQSRDDSLKAEIGQRRRIEGQLQTARDEALQASHLKSAFLANMSHEIRTPLNVILGYSAMLREQLRDQPNAPEEAIFERVERASRRLMATVHGILDMSKIEMSDFEVHPTAIALPTFVRKHVDDVHLLARQKGLTLTCTIEEPTAAVRFDEYCLSHTLTNLLDNAIKFTTEGSVSVWLGRRPDGTLALAVRDTGIGMEQAYLPHLYEAFSQETDGYTRPFEGSGLGLALAKRFVELNGASISAESRKGQGSVFTIAFSRESEVADFVEPRPRREVGREERPAASADHRPMVLVVEDDADSQAYMRALLNHRYEIVCAASGEEARRCLARHAGEVRAVLMDLSLKGDEDGLALTADILRQPEWHALPIIATTAHAFKEDRENAIAAGCRAYLAKPFDARQLLSLLAALIDGNDGRGRTSDGGGLSS